MNENDRRAHDREGHRAAKIARVLASRGAECPESREALGALLSNLSRRGKRLAPCVASLSDWGFRRVRELVPICVKKNEKLARKKESRLAAKIARVLADNGAECPETVAELGAIVATLPRGRDLAPRASSLSDSGLRQVRGQAGVFAREIRERHEQFQFIAAALASRFGDKAQLRALNRRGKEWSATVEIPGNEGVYVHDSQVTTTEEFLERIVSEVAVDLAHPIVLPAFDPSTLAMLRRRAADAAESRYFGWLAKWRSQHTRGPAPPSYGTLGEWSDSESYAPWRYHFEEQFDERIQDEIREELIGVVLAGITDERYADRVREAFWDSDQAVTIESSLEEYWRSLPVPETAP